MSRKSGNRFSEKDMRKRKNQSACSGKKPVPTQKEAGLATGLLPQRDAVGALLVAPRRRGRLARLCRGGGHRLGNRRLGGPHVLGTLDVADVPDSLGLLHLVLLDLGDLDRGVGGRGLGALRRRRRRRGRG